MCIGRVMGSPACWYCKGPKVLESTGFVGMARWSSRSVTKTCYSLTHSPPEVELSCNATVLHLLPCMLERSKVLQPHQPPASPNPGSCMNLLPPPSSPFPSFCKPECPQVCPPNKSKLQPQASPSSHHAALPAEPARMQLH